MSDRRTTSGTRTTRKSVSRPGPRPSIPGSVHHSVHHPTTEVGPELTGAVSDAMSQVIWPVTARHRHHGLDHLGRRKTAAERPSEETAAPDSCPSPRLVCDDKGIDNCGDGSDLEENLTSGCKGQLVAHTSPPTIATGASVLTAPASTGMNCGVPDSAHNLESATASTVHVSLLALYVALGVLAAALLLCWCCWSPAWFLWRFSICRHLPCCNTTCSACQRGCRHHGENRPIKVTPHNPVSGTLLRPVAPRR
ncbi:unnamed protein product [Gadus morhua 'NCC']